ncbi:hypothetical protein Ancab_011170 [Ancistrocladus abbreviatus]
MMPDSRKLLPLENEPTFFTAQTPTYTNSPESLSGLSSNGSSASCRINISSSSSNISSRSFNNCKLSPPFDSSLALTIVVLVTALFFMGFFSIYIRRFADDSSVDLTRRRRRGSPPNLSSSPYVATTGGKVEGTDPAVVEALPVYAYDRDAKQGTDDLECAICLSEFEEKERVKVIPSCGHVFHEECIDTWLSSHVTCPLCRTEKFLEPAEVKVVEEEEEVVVEAEVEVEVEVEVEEIGLDVVYEDVEDGDSELELRVDGRDTWSDGGSEMMGPVVLMRRSTSCSSLVGGVMLQRSLSF